MLAAAPRAAERLERVAGDCVLVAPREAEGALDHLAGVAPGILARVSTMLGIAPRAPYRLVLVPAGPYSDPEVAALDRRAPRWAAGYMEPSRRIGGIRLAQAARYPYGTPEAVLAHEAAHQMLHDVPGLDLPRWFEEGVATWVARDWQLEDQLLMSGRFLTRDLPRLDQLDARFNASPGEVEEAYAAAFSFVSWSTRRYGESSVRDVLQEARTRPLERAWRAATGDAFERAESLWRRDTLIRYRWIPAITALSTLWLLILALSVWVWTRRRRRAQALEATWAAEEAASDAEPEWWSEEQDAETEPGEAPKRDDPTS